MHGPRQAHVWLIFDVGRQMKLAALFCFVAAFTCGSAAIPHGHEIEFRAEPSFRDGLLIWLGRLPSGEVRCMVHRLLIVEKDGVSVHSGAKLLKEVKISSDQFDLLLRRVESEELKAYAEADDSLGLDGETWVFRVKSGRRSLEYRFWNPDERSIVGRLGKEFLRLAEIDPATKRE